MTLRNSDTWPAPAVWDGEPIMPTTTEIVYRWPSGREEVRYRRPYGSESAKRFIEEVVKLNAKHGNESPYFVRHV